MTNLIINAMNSAGLENEGGPTYRSGFLMSSEQMQRIQSLFQKHDGPIAFISRLIPGVRTLASFPVGSARMNAPEFALYATLGCFFFLLCLYTSEIT